MKKYIAVTVSLVVVLGVFLGTEAFSFVPNQDKVALHFPGLESLMPPVLSFNNINATPVSIEAWRIFNSYMAAAKAHDLPTLSNLSYQLSPTCKAALTDEAKLPACYELMNSVVYFGENFKQSDFTNVAYDDKQIVLSTDYMNNGATKTVIYFVREGSSTKLLGISFCFGSESNDECADTDADTRDSDYDGWWDDVEALFRN